MNKNCPFCGVSLPEEAAFCPHCAKSLNDRVVPKPPRPIYGKVLRLGLILLIIAGIALGTYLYTRPQVVDGAGEVFYTDEDGSYQLLLSYVDSRYYPLPGRQDTAELDGEYTLPSCLFINVKYSGNDATDAFMEKVDRVATEFIQPADSPSPMTCGAPVPDPTVPDAALVSSIHFTGRSGKAELVWTITLKNRDVIRLRQTYDTQPISTYDYYPEDVPMNTFEELQALVHELERTSKKLDVINIHLPAVTYEGGLVVENRAFNFYGNTDGTERTAFTDTMRISAKQSGVSYFYDVDIIGPGNGVGVFSTSRVHILNGTISGWDTGVLAYGDAWVNVTDCLLEQNGVGLHFNNPDGWVSHPKYVNNRFIDNEIAVLLEFVPTDVTLDFEGSLFSGNEMDIDNRCNQSLNLTEAIFQ